jgi:hypothetical protein
MPRKITQFCLYLGTKSRREDDAFEITQVIYLISTLLIQYLVLKTHLAVIHNQARQVFCYIILHEQTVMSGLISHYINLHSIIAHYNRVRLFFA